MILESIVTFFLDIVYYILTLIPVIDFGFNFTNIDKLVNVIVSVSCFVPVGTFFTAVGIWVILANIDLTISVLNWVIRKIPGVS